MDRNKRIEIVTQTSEILKQQSYLAKDPETNADTLITLLEVLDAACQGTRLHLKNEQLNMPAITSPKETKTYMSIETTLRCLNQLSEEGNDNVLVLNFAGAKNPGGGLHQGLWEQEENMAAVGRT